MVNGNTNDLGACTTTTTASESAKCGTYYYTGVNGFADDSAAELKCVTCISASSSIIGTTHGSCIALSSICPTASDYFKPLSANSHLGNIY